MDLESIDIQFNENQFELYADAKQWDYGQVIKIHGLDNLTQVEFSLQEKYGMSVPVNPTYVNGVATVRVPAFVFGYPVTEDYTAYAYLVMMNEESRKTVGKITLNIKSRPKPTEYDERVNHNV